MKERIEQRFLDMDVLAEMSSDPTPIPVIRGIAPVFNAISEVLVDPDLGMFRELIEPTALDKVMANALLDTRARFDHKILLGRTKNGTLYLNKTEKGLEYTIYINPDDPEAMSAYEKVRRKDVDGSSFMFTVPEGGDVWEMQDGIPLRRVKEFNELMDVGPVTFPAYPQTSADVRSKFTEMRQAQQKPSAPEGADGGQDVTDQKAAELRAHTLALMQMELEIDQDKE